MRRWRDGEAAIDGFLDDYAAFGLAQVDLYAATLDAAHLELAGRLAEAMLERFEDKRNGGFYASAPGAADLLLRLKEDYDGAEPSGNSLAAEFLLRLGAYLSDPGLIAAGRATLAAFPATLAERASTAPQMVCALMRAEASETQLVVTEGSGRQALLGVFGSRFRPFSAVYSTGPLERRHPELSAMAPQGGRAAAYLCENFTCKSPVTSPEALASLLD